MMMAVCITANAQYEFKSNKNKPNGYAGLNAQGKLDSNLLLAQVKSFNNRTGRVYLTQTDVIAALGGYVLSFNGRQSAVTLTSTDIINAMGYEPYSGAANPNNFINNSSVNFSPNGSGDVTGSSSGSGQPAYLYPTLTIGNSKVTTAKIATGAVTAAKADTGRNTNQFFMAGSAKKIIDSLVAIMNATTPATASVWTIGTSVADISWWACTYGGGLFAAISSTGTGNQIMTSPDGYNWTSRSTINSRQYLNIGFGNGVFLGLPYNTSGGTLDSVLRSTDGVTWTKVSTGTTAKYLYGVCYGNGRFVITGYGVSIYSTDGGLTWTNATMPVNDTYNGVCYGNGKFVAVKGNNKVATSTDGSTWTDVTSPTSGSTWLDVIYANGLYVAVGTGSSNNLMTSPDGNTWTLQTVTNIGMRTIRFGNGVFVIAGNNGSNSILTSTTGLSWTQRTTPAANGWTGLAYGNGMFVSVGTSGTGNRVMTSGYFFDPPTK